jgi:hypothetical protein
MPSPERSEQPLPRRPVLFPAGTAPARRRRRLVFVVLYGALAAALIWPLYPLGLRILPPLFGLPPSFAWVIVALAAGFCLLLGLYLGDLRDERTAGTDRGGEGG